MHVLISCLGRNALANTLALLGFAVLFASCQKDEAPAPNVDQELVSNLKEQFEDTGYMDASDLETERFWEMVGAPEGTVEDKVRWIEEKRDADYLTHTGEPFPQDAFKLTKAEQFEDRQTSKSAKASVDLSWSCGPVWHQGDWHTANYGNSTENWYYRNSCQSHATAAVQNSYTKRHVNSGFGTRSPYYIIRRHRDRWHFAAWWTLSYNMNICRWDGSLPISSSSDASDVKHMGDLVYSVGTACNPASKKFPTWTSMYGSIITSKYSRVSGSFGNRVKHMVRDYQHPVAITIWLDNNGINLVNRWVGGGNYKVWDNQPINYGMGLHVVTVVGYDDNTSLFKIKNSWGSGWGQGGYFYATKDRLNHFLYDAATYAF
ncbi:MAG: C1 family peptidase [Bacteroidia bacterium]